MSRKNLSNFCVVVDCSIAQAAGSEDSIHPCGVNCREFLRQLRISNHRLAWSDEIRHEWDRHRSIYASTWLLLMERLGKIQRVQPESYLQERINGTDREQGVKDALNKDAHLVEAAMVTARRIASLDDRARGHFANLSADVPEIGEVIWVNPVNEDEQASQWLANGAPDEPARQLCRHPRS